MYSTSLRFPQCCLRTLFLLCLLFIPSIVFAESSGPISFSRTFQRMHKDILQRSPALAPSVVRRPSWVNNRMKPTRTFRSRLVVIKKQIKKSRGSKTLRWRTRRFHLGRYIVWVVLRQSVRLSRHAPSLQSLQLLQKVLQWTKTIPSLIGVKRRALVIQFKAQQSVLVALQLMKSRQTFAHGLQLYLYGLTQQQQLLSFPYQAWVSHFLWRGYLFEATQTMWHFRKIFVASQKKPFPKGSFRKVVFYKRSVDSFFKAPKSVRLSPNITILLPRNNEAKYRQVFSSFRLRMTYECYLSQVSKRQWTSWKKKWHQESRKLKRSSAAWVSYGFSNVLQAFHKHTPVVCKERSGFWRLLCDPQDVSSIESLLRTSPDTL